MNRYASLLLTGREQPGGEGSICGREDEAYARAKAEERWIATAAEAAIHHLEVAVQQGSYRGAFMLATLLLSGLAGYRPLSGSQGAIEYSHDLGYRRGYPIEIRPTVTSPA